MQELFFFSPFISPNSCLASRKHKRAFRTYAEGKQPKLFASSNVTLDSPVREGGSDSSEEETDPTLQQKHCARCKQHKALTKFAKHGRSKDGRARFCLVCSLEEAVKRPVDEPSVQFRTCRECGELKHVQQFTKNAASPTGLDRKCRSCTLKITRKLCQRYREVLEQKGGPLVSEKRCSLCSQVKPAAKFYKSATSRGGLYSRCRGCTTALARGKKPEEIRQAAAASESKMCLQCEQILPMENYAEDLTKADGREAHCRACACKQHGNEEF